MKKGCLKKSFLCVVLGIVVFSQMSFSEGLSFSSEVDSIVTKSAEGYVADTYEKAVRTALRIDFIEGEVEDPSLMCGPLSIRILQDSGYVDRSLSVHEAWLLNARETSGIATLEKFFPKSEFSYENYSLSTGSFDWNKLPLKEGDWFYLYGGSFDHMIVVTRVDSDGKVYSVNNINSEEGFVIKETLLWDPKSPEEGYFQKWNNPKNKFGTTGTQGFLIIKKGLLIKRNILIEDSNGEIIVAENEQEVIHPASMIKVAIAGLFLKQSEERGLSIEDLEVKGTQGRTYYQLLYAMLVKSEEVATEILEKEVSVKAKAQLDGWGLKSTTLTPRRSTPEDMVNLLKGVAQGDFLEEEYRQLLLDLMGVQTSSDSARLGLLVNEGYKVLNKRGSIATPIVVVGDMGIISRNGKTFYVFIELMPGDSSLLYFDLEKELESLVKNDLLKVLEDYD